VKELDIGDSFTTTLVDILVTELADRDTRSNPEDRRMIGERTAKSLRALINPTRVYSTSAFRRMSARRNHLPMYLTHPPEEMDLDDDEDEFDSILDGTESIAPRRAAMINTYTSPPTSSLPIGGSNTVIPFRSTSPTPLTLPDEPLPPLPYSRSYWVPPRSSIPAAHSLTRSSSIRRPTRSRTVDFNDFTSRRRSTTRDNADTGGGANAENSAASDTRNRDIAWSPPAGTRRFFSAIRHRRANTGMFDEMTVEDAAAAALSHTVDAFPTETETSEERTNDNSTTLTTNPLPRLRRGGLRAPESLLSAPGSLLPRTSRQVFPAETVVAGDGESRRAPSPPEISEYIFDRPLFPAHEPESGATFSVEVASYPTPGSTIENENST
jgi:hypothetical protein